MLYTNLNHIESAGQLLSAIENNAKVIFCLGKMTYNCIQAFDALEQIEKELPDIKIFDIEFDNPEFDEFKQTLNDLVEHKLPYYILYENAKIVKTDSGVKDENNLKKILNTNYIQIKKKK